jgi:YD repeat-containing protein
MRDGRYRIQDPTFASGDQWVTARAIDEESSGYYLVPSNAPQSSQWRTASLDEASRVRGMGYTTQNQPGATTPTDATARGCGSRGMCVADAKLMTLGLNLNDTPVGYSPQKGPPVLVRLTYNQREAGQPAVFAWGNVGPKWTHNMSSWVTDNPASPGNAVTRYVAGGGYVDYTWGYSFNSMTGAFSPERQGQAVLVRIPATGAATSYELRMKDGSKQVFSRADGSATYPRRLFLTQVVDARGNTLSLNYDAQLRLTSVVDATGRSTGFAYANTTFPLLVTRITDPFGRYASVAYDTQGRLASITDVLGLVSSFTYDANSLIDSMTTPYGKSSFVYGDGGNNTRFLEITDPIGLSERFEFRHFAPIADSDTVVPFSTFPLINQYLTYRNTFHWDKHAYPDRADYNKARITHWLHNRQDQTSPMAESTKLPLERRVWRLYPGADNSVYESTAGMQDQPVFVGRVLDDGTTQAQQYTYNAVGKPLTMVDEAGRRTVFTYDATGINLLTVQRQTSTTGALSTLASFTYNSQYLPLTYIDASGQTTQFSTTPPGSSPV